MKVVIIGTDPHYLLNFRGDLIKYIIKNNHHVTAMSLPVPVELRKPFSDLGVQFVSYPVQRNGLNPINDINTFFSLKESINAIKPDVILAYTIKPIIWGNLAVINKKEIKTYSMIEGLGFVFQSKTFFRKILRSITSYLYKKALSKTNTVIFLNQDNLKYFTSNHIVAQNKTTIINGIGVNLDYYNYEHLPVSGIRFLTIGRLLGEKGLREYAQAAKLVKNKYPNAIFQLLGPEDPSPDGIPITEINSWQEQKWIEYLGSTNDVRPFIKDCHIYVLASYHEGLPRTTMEAMAMGRPILTTDAVGCKETVTNGRNGYIVPKANAEALAERMIWFIENRDQWERMGKCSRELAEERYDVHKINKILMEIMGLTLSPQET